MQLSFNLPSATWSHKMWLRYGLFDTYLQRKNSINDDRKQWKTNLSTIDVLHSRLSEKEIDVLTVAQRADKIRRYKIKI